MAALLLRVFGMRSILLVALLSQSALADDPAALALRQRLARLLKLSPGRELAPRAQKPLATPLACQVLGTLQSRVIELSLASVQCGTHTRSVHVGDAVEDALVEEIGFGTVTVRRGERLEVLGRGVALAAAVLPVAPALAEGRVPRAMIDEALQNPGPLLGQVQLLPAFSAGKWAGLRASYVKEGSVVSTLGLQKGDVIRSVNGKPLDSVQAALAALQLIGTSSELTVELDRGGQSVTRRLRIE